MSERYANDFWTTLAAPMLIGDLDAHVLAAAPVALQGGQFRIAIESELLLVTAGEATTTWTVTRGVEGTTPVAHAAGVTVAHVLTAASLAAVVGTGVAISALPAVVTPLGTDEFIVNQSGTSKKVTRLQGAAGGVAALPVGADAATIRLALNSIIAAMKSAALMAASYADVVLSDTGLVSYWRLSDLTDAKGGRTLAAIGSPAFTATGAITSDTDKGVTVPDGSYLEYQTHSDAALQPAGAFSFEAWVKVASAVTGYGVIFQVDDGGGNNGWTMQFNGTGVAMSCTVRGTGAADLSLGHDGSGVGPVLTDNAWHHLVMTVTAPGASSTLTAYVDGVSVGTVTGAWTWDSLVWTYPSFPRSMGISVAVDEAAFYGRTLSAADVAAHYAAGIA